MCLTQAAWPVARHHGEVRAGLGGFRRSLDAALVSPGQRTPFPSLDPASVDMTQGISFCLANNIWGTNCAPFTHGCCEWHVRRPSCDEH